MTNTQFERSVQSKEQNNK